MIRVLAALLIGALVMAAETAPIAITTVAQTEVITITVPVGWSSSIIPAAEREAYLQRRERIVINGGYFDAQGQPDGLLINGQNQTGRLRSDSPYSGFVWADAAGAIHIARTATAPTAPKWAIQSGPLLVEQGQASINRSTHVAQRTVIALRQGQVLIIRTGRIGLKELADALAATGIETAINLDGGPSSALHARIGTAAVERRATAQVPYFVGMGP